MSSSTASGGVPPGFRFHPTDEELLQYYLKKKISFQKFEMEVIKEVDLNKMEPWDLQERCRIGSTPQNEWYFFSHKDRKYPTGSRTNRATNMGFWKATGRDKCIRNGYRKIGMRKTLVFYRGRAPHGQKTDWIMHEYRLEDADDPNNNPAEDGWVICRVFKKKNFFKIGGSNNETGACSTNTEQHHQHHLSSNTFELNMHRDNNHYSNFLHHHTNGHGLQPNPSTGFELNKTTDLALHYSHHLQPPHSQYSLFPSQTLASSNPKTINGGYEYPGMTSVAASPLMVKQLMSTARDCESGDDDSFRYQNGELGTCEEPATHPRVITEGRDEGVTNNEWTTMLVSSHMAGTEDATNKDVVRFEDSGASSVHQINHVQMRGEMDFWGYGNK